MQSLAKYSLITTCLCLVLGIGSTKAALPTAADTPTGPYRVIFKDSFNVFGNYTYELYSDEVNIRGKESALSVYNDTTAVGIFGQLIDFFPLVSTEAGKNARVESGTTGNDGIPIYMWDGSSFLLVASDSADLWDGTLDVAVDFNEQGTTSAGSIYVWTGTDAFGNTVGGGLGSATNAIGITSFTDDRWMNAFTGTLSQASGTPGSVYALSDVISGAAPAVPEPSTYVAMGSMLAVVLFRRYRRKQTT